MKEFDFLCIWPGYLCVSVFIGYRTISFGVAARISVHDWDFWPFLLFLMNRHPNRNRRIDSLANCLVRVINERMFHSSSINRNGSVFFSLSLSRERILLLLQHTQLSYACTHAHAHILFHPSVRKIVIFGFGPYTFIVNILHITTESCLIA